MPELSDFPVEILRMIAERCELRPMFILRSTSKLMKEVVDQSKFALHSVGLDIWCSGSLGISFEYKNRHGNITHHKIQIRIEDEDSMEKTAKRMANIFKNAEIEIFTISENENLIKVFLKKMMENLKSPLKARAIHCRPKIDPFGICDKSYVQQLYCHHDDPNFFQEYKEILINLDKVTLYMPMDITDEDVLSMKATRINLTSEKFSAEMVNQMVDKFIAKGLIDSEFRLENPKVDFIKSSRIKIPDGFSNPTEIRLEHEKIEGDKKMELIVSNYLVLFRISRWTQRAQPNRPRFFRTE